MGRQCVFRGTVEGIATSNLDRTGNFSALLNEEIDGIPNELAVVAAVKSPWLKIRKDDELIMDLEIFTEISRDWNQEIIYAVCHKCFNKNLQVA